MLADEGREADRNARPRRVWLYERKATPPIRSLRDTRTGWGGPGVVDVTDAHLELSAEGRTRRSSLSTIHRVEWEGAFLWVRRSHAHDWLLRFETAEDAARLGAALEAVVS